MNHTIINHMDEAMDQVFGIKPEIKRYKFTIRYQDGSKSEPVIKATSIELARKSLNYWFPGFDIELGVKELS